MAKSIPPCPMCGVHMIATSPVENSRQTFECLRCGNREDKTHFDEPLIKLHEADSEK